MAGRPLVFEDVKVAQHAAVGPLKGDEYYGKGFQTVVRTILEARKITGAGPATVNEIYLAMTSGGYVFDAKDDENAKRGLRISLGKSTHTFHKLPNGKFGLLEWYPAIKPAKANGAKSSNGDSTTDDAVEDFFAEIDAKHSHERTEQIAEPELVGAGESGPKKPR